MDERQRDATTTLTTLAALATLLFLGAFREFLSAVYFHNLAALALNATALYALLLLAPAVFLVPRVARDASRLVLPAVILLALGRVLLVPARGTPFHLPLAGLASASWLVLLGALLAQSGRDAPRSIGSGIAFAFAIDVALRWQAASTDPLLTTRGLVLAVPLAILAVYTATRVATPTPTSPGEAPRAPWLAGVALGAWFTLESLILANAAGTARWNTLDPVAISVTSALGLAAGGIALGLRRRISRRVLLATNGALVLALIDHTWLHTPALPALLAIGQLAMALDLALILHTLRGARGIRALPLAAVILLVGHFLFAFTYLFDFVPLSALWKDHAPQLLISLGLALLIPMLWVGARGLDAPVRDQRRTAGPWAAALALAILAALMSTPATVEAPPVDGTFRVMTFNVHQAFSNTGVLDPALFVEVVRAEDADIITLQEADTPRFTSGNVDIAGILAFETGYHLAYGQPSRAQAFGGTILSRFPILEWSAHRLPSTSDDRWYTEALVEVNGTNVWVYAVHFGLPQEDRTAHAAEILRRAATREGPRIIAGDLNSCAGGICASYEGMRDDVHADMTKEHEDAWTAAGRASDDPLGMTYPSTDPRERIDHILFTPDIEVREVRVIRSDAALRASDHLPLVADLRLR